MQEPQPLGRHLIDEKVDARHVAARAGEACDKTLPDRVFTHAEDDWNRRRCSFGRARDDGAGRGDHGNLPADQVGQQGRQPVVSAFQPVILDRHVLTLDVTGFVEAFRKPAT